MQNHHLSQSKTNKDDPTKVRESNNLRIFFLKKMICNLKQFAKTYFCFFEKGKGNHTENFFLLSEVISPKGGPVKASSQAKRYFKLDSQATLWLMLPGWARV